MQTASLLRANVTAIPLFAACNSGAPRMQMGKRVARGPATFSYAGEFPRSESGVVEVAFGSDIALPADSEYDADGTWRPLASIAA